MPDLDDDAWRIIARQLADSDLASAVALKRCNSRFKDLVTPVVAEAVTRLRERWQDAARRCRPIQELLTDSTEVLTSLDVSSNNISGETDYIKASEVEGESKEVGAMVIYEGREMVVSQGVDSDGDLKLRDTTGVLAIAKALEADAVLTDLNLGSNNIRDEGAAAIAEALRGNGVLTSLNVSGNKIGPNGATAIAEALKVNEVLTKLNLDGDELELPQLRGTDPVTSLDLSDKGFGRLGPASAVVIASLIAGNEVLTNLVLGDNDIGVEGAAALASALRVNGVLAKLDLDGHELDLPKLRGTDPVTSLDLSGKGLGPASAIVIASLIAGNAVLTELDLSRNDIAPWCFSRNDMDDAGAVALASALRVNEVLTSLDLSHQKDQYGRGGIGLEGAEAIAEALQANAVLTDLYLFDNSIGDEGAMALASALRVNGVLTSLDLGQNQIGDEGAEAIGKALAVNGVLTGLYLCNNNIYDEGAAAIAEALRGNEVLKSMDLRGNRLGEGEDEIIDVVRGREGFELAGSAF